MAGEGIAIAEGIGFLAAPPQPRVSDRFHDLWFYGYSPTRDMSGFGVAIAEGVGELTE